MIRFLVKRPIAVLVSFFAITILGIVAFFKLPVSLLPNIDIPVISIKVDVPNQSAQDIESRIATPLRSGLTQLKKMSSIESRATDGKLTITVEFETDVDISMAFIEVNEKLDMSMNSLPRDAPRPLVSKNSVADIPIFSLDVFGKKEPENRAEMAEVSNFAREVIRRRLEQIPSVAMVDITGYTESQIELSPKSDYLQSMRIGHEALSSAFKENNVNLGNIMVRDGHYKYFLRFSSELQNLDAIRKIPLNIHGRLFRLGDLADVTYSYADPKGYYFHQDRQAINFAVVKQSAARIGDLQEDFYTVIEQMRTDYPNLQFEVSKDQTALLDYSIGNLKQDLFIGGVLAFFLMLIFIRKLKMAILIGITIPLSLVLSQLGFYIFGISINIISLGGLILGLTMIIDNSIVVMDTISDHQNKGKNRLESAVAGTNEIMRPLITSVLTNCAVFIPLIFLSGLAGAIFYDQALSIVVGVLSSLIVALLLLPPLFHLFHKDAKKKRTSFEIPVFVNVTSIYDKLLKWSFKHPIFVTLLFLFTTIGGVFLFMSINKDRLPPITRTEWDVRIDWNELLDTEEAKARVLIIFERQKHRVSNYTAWIGEQHYLLPNLSEESQNQTKLYFKMREEEQFFTFQDTLRQTIASLYPQAIVSMYPTRNAFDDIFYQKKAPLRLMVSDVNERKLPELETLTEWIDLLAQKLKQTPIAPLAVQDKIRIRIDFQRAAQMGVDSEAVVSRLTSVIQDVKVSDYQDAQKLIPIYIVRESSHSIQTLLASTFVKNSFGEDVPLNALVSAVFERDYPFITAGNFGQFYPIDIHTDNPESTIRIIEDFKSENDQVEIAIDGSFFENQELVKDMIIILLISVLLLYFILAAQFESLVQPLFILVELPIAICGSMVFLYLGNSSLNLMSMIGIVVMSGLIINDSILKIDAINQLRNLGVPLMEAIFEGGHKRIRSIIMISLTSFGALLPTLFMSDLGSELQKPLALALMGGMAVGLLVSLFFVPIVYWFIYKKSEDHV